MHCIFRYDLSCTYTVRRLSPLHHCLCILQCPFARIVLKFDYKNVQFLHKLQALITETNARALNMDDMPPHIIEAALSTYKLSL